MKRIFAALFALLLVMSSGAAGWQVPRVHAEAGDAQIVNSEPIADFPMTLTFEGNISSATGVQLVRLVYAVNLDSCADSYAIAYPTFDRANTSKATWIWDLRKANGLPIGTQISYYWQVFDDNWDVTQSETYQYEWTNKSIEWKEKSNEDLQVFWVNGDDAFGQLLLDDAQAALDKNSSIFGLKPHKRYRIYVFESGESLKKNQLFEPSWTGGLSITEAGVVLIGINPEDESDVKWGRGAMVHELTHAVFAQKEFTCIGRFPTWVVEGTAMYVEDTLHPLAEQNKSYLDYVAKNGVFSVRRMNDGFGVDPEQVDYLYTQSFYLVHLLIENYEPAKFIAFQESIQSGESAEAAFIRIYNLSFEELEQKLAESLGTDSRSVQMTPTAQLTPTYIPTIIPIGSSDIRNSQTEETVPWGIYLSALAIVITLLVVGLYMRAKGRAKLAQNTTQSTFESTSPEQSEES